MGRTMVKVRTIGHDTLTFQTISLEYGASSQFLLPIRKFEEMDRSGQLLTWSMMNAEHPIPHQAAFVRLTSSRQLFICFHWDEIRFYNDFVPYSFFFREFRGGQPGICGGLILHGQENMAKAQYSIHT